MSTLNHRQKRETYWSSGRMSQGLQRARLPFRNKNLITGLGILSFTFGVYAYSISAVKQDDFSDIPVPSEDEIRRANELNEASRSIEGSKIDDEQLQNQTKISSLPPIGLLGSATSWIRSGIVTGAPPIDQVGRLSDRKTIDHEKKIV